MRSSSSRGDDDVATYHALSVGSVRLALQGVDSDTDLATALTLGVFPSNRTVDVDDVVSIGEHPAHRLRPGDILLRHANVLGVMRADWGEFTSRGDVTPRDLLAPGGPRNFPRPRETDTYGAIPEPWPGNGRAQAVMGGVRKRFRAYAALEAPGAVTAGQQFALSVGFSDRPQTADEEEQPVIVPGAPERLDFVVQVAGFGLSFPEGIRRDLTVDRDNPTTVRVELAVVATAVKHRATRTLEVSFEYDGERCGRAWHDVVVTNPAAADSAPGSPDLLTDTAQRRTGGTAVALSVDGRQPSLAVEIRIEPGRPQLKWIFHTRAGVPRPADRILTQLEQPSAQAFAEMVMAQLPGTKGTLALPNVVRGMGRVIDRAIPDEFWEAVEATWRTLPEDQAPSSLIITSEPFIPWELAPSSSHGSAGSAAPSSSATPAKRERRVRSCRASRRRCREGDRAGFL
jgi:hypothetical protein